MKNMRIGLAVIVVCSAGLFSFSQLEAGSIKGEVTPGDKVVRAWAVSAEDTLNSEVLDGSFEFRDIKAGTYSVIIEAEKPYVHTYKKNVKVGTDRSVDLGRISLKQK